ncbi:SusD/RagB family nutrient-binding outer membrane lipoprotein [Sinomicrobium weinanense]|uniref:SusD/RagB family nutrient-binding outer membrane lipoprotein n=1 Tax=Sinomicrobium weinanense TaxID=2842200 RepID=A0A926JUW8_9FLAO|nr:SusD/RagB family nutrient-binding outer membrane lipoprotein [Sinomicrobium weinanense]MBC9798002.1 SusD/RagB family nutrient-binding outer membrane lipoprotein [Sinomicrobium weinanense]MBU3123599.1 SusD/RagB family nutrient-binding outer membrane lipoprotein [Sinomicrobium weinanense]
MKNISKPLILIALLSGFLNSCSKMEELQDDPNRTTDATPELILTQLEIQAFNNIGTSAALASRHLVNTDGVNSNQYYNWQRSDFGNYDLLKQVRQMVLEAEEDELSVYTPLARFFNSFFIVGLTQTFGDVPYSEAIRAAEENFTPVYDRQEDIYLIVLDDLKTASDELAKNDETILGDVIYNGDHLKWRKLINSFYLRVLLSLSAKTGNPGLDIAGRFREIADAPSAYPLLASNEDNGALPFHDIEGNRYPLFQNNGLQTAFYMEKTFVDKLKALQDPRLFSFAEITPAAADQGLTANDFEAYNGLKGSVPLDENVQIAVNGNASRINKRYYDQAGNEPSLLMSYSELQFILAEAASRGWIDGDADAYYREGIRASMEFYNIAESAINTYLENPGTQPDPGNEIASILTQKHIAMFMNTGWQIFYEQRRTGYPEFDVSGGGVLNNGKIPKRWMYPSKEETQNGKNLEAAITRQYPEGDNINAEMWLLKEE